MTRWRTPEGALLNLVMDWLAAERIFALRMNTGMLRNAMNRPVYFGVPGMADILAFPIAYRGDGVHVTAIPFPLPTWIELKAGTKQTELQKSFEQQVVEQGHRYLLIHTLDELKAAMK